MQGATLTLLEGKALWRTTQELRQLDDTVHLYKPSTPPSPVYQNQSDSKVQATFWAPAEMMWYLYRHINGQPLVILMTACPWGEAQDDTIYKDGMNEVIETANKLARKRGLLSDLVYMNYARTGAPVIQGYGQENVRFLKGVSAKYDPNSVFQKLVPGGFKLLSV